MTLKMRFLLIAMIACVSACSDQPATEETDKAAMDAEQSAEAGLNSTGQGKAAEQVSADLETAADQMKKEMTKN